MRNLRSRVKAELSPLPGMETLYPNQHEGNSTSSADTLGVKYGKKRKFFVEHLLLFVFIKYKIK